MLVERPRAKSKLHHQYPQNRRRPSALAIVIAGYAIILSIFGAAEVTWGMRGFVLAATAMFFVPAAIKFGASAGWAVLPRLARFGAIIFIVFCLIQLVPMPSAIWTLFPGNEKRAAILAIAGFGHAWMPLTLTPIASLYGTLLAISTVILLCGLAALPRNEFRMIVALTFVIVIVGIAIGVVQVTTAGQVFAFYSATDAGALVGFYANKNHMALALVCSVPLAHLLSVRSTDTVKHAHFAFLGYWAFVALIIPLTNSRAGLAIGLLVSLIMAWCLFGKVRTRAKVGGSVIVALIVATFLLAPLPASLVGRLDSVADDLRWPMLLHSLDVWRIYWIFGSGLGSFADVFMTYEKLEWLFPTYVNNVHNDYVQLGIETGIFGLLSLGLFLLGLASLVPAGLRAHSASARASAIVGLTIVLAFMLHSVVDYPLRRPAALLIAIIGVAALCRASVAVVGISDCQQTLSGRHTTPEHR